MLKTVPSVFAVGEDYQIMAPIDGNSLFWVRVDGQEYHDDSNGILRSMPDIHRVTVPMDALNRAGKYTVCQRAVLDRAPYFPKLGDVQESTYSFRPVPAHHARAYHIADAHNMIDTPVAAAKAYGPIDFLILNGDLLHHSGNPEKFINIYEIAAQITGGNIPVVCSRGNHDLRGQYAERLAEYTPSDRGNTYYTFRLGGIWGIVLDCGEDKLDSHPEYHNTVCCHSFRQKETRFIQSVIRHAEEEYLAPGVEYRVVVCHVPFTSFKEDPFDIERDIYAEWARLLKDNVHPHVMICGHDHKLYFGQPGGIQDDLGQPCALVVGAAPKGDGSEYFAAAGFDFHDGRIDVCFNDNLGGVIAQHSICCE